MSDNAPPNEIFNVQQTTCCIVGGGPAGTVLALLLARQGIPVTLLEARKDFDRNFRGDTLHPSVLEIMEQLGLADGLLQLPHTQLRQLSLMTPRGSFTLVDFSRLKTRYPYIALMPQVQFLEFIVQEAQRYPNFQLVLGANVQELVEEEGRVRGVRYRSHGGWHEVRAQLVVGADGRHSRLRHLVGFEPASTSPPMDVLWFRLPRPADASNGVMARVGGGRMLVILDRGDRWQIGYVFPKGGYQQIRSAGLEVLRQSVVEVAPELSQGIEHLKHWSQVAFLSVEASRLPRWYCSGLLLVGDAAHVMSPVGGVGINYAIQDAVVAANLLSHRLQTGQVQLRDLAAVQRQREFPTRVIQAFQSLMQRQLVARALQSQQSFAPPAFFRFPPFQKLLARLIAFGIWPVRVQHP